MRKQWLIVPAVLLIVSIYGCVENSKPLPSNQATGTAIQQADSHVSSAEAAAQRIKPHADATGNELVNVVSDEHKSAHQQLAEAAAENQKQAKDIQSLQEQVAAQKKRADTAEATYGYRAEVWVKRFVYTVVTIVVLHFVLLLVGVLLPVFAPGALLALKLIKFIGAVLNPIAWAQAIADHVHLSRASVCPECPPLPQALAH